MVGGLFAVFSAGQVWLVSGAGDAGSPRILHVS